MCLNPKDPEAHRIYTEGGVWPSLYAGQGGRCQAVLVGVLDLMCGKPGCAFGDGAVSPTPKAGAGERERRPRGRDRGELT